MTPVFSDFLTPSPSTLHKLTTFLLVCVVTLNPTIFNIICWLAGSMGQTTHQPSVWCSKYYLFFIISFKILCKNCSIYLLIFYKFTKIRIKSFECPMSIKYYEKIDAWNIRRLVDKLFVTSTQRTSVLYCRLSDFSWWRCTAWKIETSKRYFNFEIKHYKVKFISLAVV